MVAQRTGALLIDGDDFYRHANWDELSDADRADLCIDWRAQRDVLAAVANQQTTGWQPYDWDADDGRLSVEWTEHQPKYAVVVLEGTFSARPEMHDLLTLKVLLTAEPSQQRERIIEREGTDHWRSWAHMWMGAEDHYFSRIMPPEKFDLVISN